MLPTPSASFTEAHCPRLEVRAGVCCGRHDQRTTRTVTVTTIRTIESDDYGAANHELPRLAFPHTAIRFGPVTVVASEPV